MHRKLFQTLGLGAGLAAGLAAVAASAPRTVHACGGFFCSSANPVNQAAEQIIFVDNPDETVTAVIQIMYEGPAERFAWVLPVPGVPDVEVSSDQALDALKQLTNPLYQLNTVFEEGCGFGMGPGFANSGTAAPSAGDSDEGGGVVVQASGAVGPYNYDVISVDSALADPAQAAIDWFTEHDYDVGSLGADVLRPYLEEQLNLIAFKLQKGNSSGSIRPVMLTYDSPLPSIPIRPTAVAANDDMGVMVWVLSDARAIPENYKALELNEALIDWFNPNNNYNEVVSRAADEAEGQGFVTEYAGATQTLIDSGLNVFPEWQQQTWADFSSRQHPVAAQMVQEASQNWSAWDGFDDALQTAVTLPETIDFRDFKNCIPCYIEQEGVVFDTTTYLTKLYELVIKPMMDTQALIESRPYITRLYTTMSADEMILDPVFDFNPDLADVSNLHTADRVIECVEGSADPFNGPWSVALPQGDVVRGEENNVWPIEIDSMPAALKILQYGTEGAGRIIEDRSDDVSSMMGGGGPVPSGGAGSSAPGGDDDPGSDGETPDPTEGDGEPTNPTASMNTSGSSCSTAAGNPAPSLAFITLALLALVRRRRPA